jgi:hypothetical protein
MVRRLAFFLPFLMLAAPVAGAELFTLDHDPLSSDYTGPSGPLVMSGDIVPGDYERLLARIEENPQQFLQANRIIVAADEGDVTEAIRIGELLKKLLTQVDVGPLTGRCSGPCFLIFVAAARRGTDGSGLLGLYAPAADTEEHQRVLDYLVANAVPSDLIERMLTHDREDPYWLSEPEERVLGVRSAAFEQRLGQSCGWSADLERAVYAGERPMEDLKTVWACGERLVQPAARHALCLALAERDAAKKKAADEAAAVAAAAQVGQVAPGAPGAPGAAQRPTKARPAAHAKQPKAAKKSTCNDPTR